MVECLAVRIVGYLYDDTYFFFFNVLDSYEIYSQISRASIDALKDHFWEGVTIEEKRLIKHLKGLLDIP